MTIDLNLNRPGPRLKFRFYGTRGSIPVAHHDFLEFGGNTTCMALLSDDIPEAASVIDAGTGIRSFGKALKAMPRYVDIEYVTVAFTHFHWDHIQGFPFFDPAYDSRIQIRLMAMGADRQFKDLQQIFSDQMQERYFPVKLEDMGSDMQFIYPESDVKLVGNAKVEVIAQNHPGGSWGYRIELGGRIIVICTDIEHGDEIDMRIVDFARGADLLVHEAQYTNEELASHRGWGHSTYDQALEVAKLAEVGYLVMTHHDPDHDDSFLFAREMECQRVMKNCCLARERMEFLL
jgi:phosphoribosyl 1,2-cyclic phosphodiesterase